MAELRIHTCTAAEPELLVKSSITAERITFRREGVELVGDLRLSAAGGRRPAVALTGPFTGVKEQVTGTYAELLARAGLTTLAFDHRGFGESGGRRQHEDSQGKLADLRAAVSALAARQEVDQPGSDSSVSASAAATPFGPPPLTLESPHVNDAASAAVEFLHRTLA